jgi:hypothetical protein
LVYRWSEGEPFDGDDLRQWQALAYALARVHTAPPDDLQRFSPHPVNLSYFWSVLGPSLPPLQHWLGGQRLLRLADLVGLLHERGRQTVDGALPLWGDVPVPVHGDLRPDNFLDAFGAVVLLDWEMFGLGDPALEVARFLHEQRQAVSAEVLEDWLDAYLSSIGDAAAALRVEVYRRRLLPLEDAAYLLAGGMKLAPEERRSPELQESAEFLATTLHAALAQAADALEMGDLHGDEGVAAECAALFSGEITI